MSLLFSLPILAQTAPAQPEGFLNYGIVIQMICIGVIFYFLLIRPQQKKAKDLKNLVSSLKTGDRVVTTGGIHGVVANVKEGATLMLKIADNVKVEVDKSAVVMVESATAPAEKTVATKV